MRDSAVIIKYLLRSLSIYLNYLYVYLFHSLGYPRPSYEDNLSA